MPRDFEYYDDHPDEADADARSEFADPGGRSALRAAGPGNPRDRPCPTCHAPVRLTPADVARGYQCDACADAAENGMDRDLVCGGRANGCTLCEPDEE